MKLPLGVICSHEGFISGFGYYLDRREDDSLVVLFGDEVVAVWGAEIARKITVPMLMQIIAAHQLERMEESAPLERLYNPPPKVRRRQWFPREGYWWPLRGDRLV